MKNKIEITENAEKHIASVLSNDKSKFFRITVLGGGCSGFQYKFEFDNTKNENDLLFEHNLISVLVDNTSFEYLKGSKVDYVQELIGSSFKIDNPQATASCGCGTSFSI